MDYIRHQDRDIFPESRREVSRSVMAIQYCSISQADIGCDELDPVMDVAIYCVYIQQMDATHVPTTH